MAGAYLQMESSPVEFNSALLYLQALIGTEIGVFVNAYGQFFGAGFAGRLVRVETLPPDDRSIRLVLEDGNGLHLDPADVEAALARGPGGEEWLELQAAFGVTVIIESGAPPQRS
jgi:hypothetical protein